VRSVLTNVTSPTTPGQLQTSHIHQWISQLWSRTSRDEPVSAAGCEASARLPPTTARASARSRTPNTQNL